jgi:hypothetical protein
VPAIGVAAVLLMTVKVVPTGSRPRIIPRTFKVALPAIVTPFAMTSSALESLRLASNV